jgi:hypothetical protein
MPGRRLPALEESMLLDKSSDKPDFQAAFLQISSQITRKTCVLDVALVLHQK